MPSIIGKGKIMVSLEEAQKAKESCLRDALEFIRNFTEDLEVVVNHLVDSNDPQKQLYTFSFVTTLRTFVNEHWEEETAKLIRKELGRHIDDHENCTGVH